MSEKQLELKLDRLSEGVNQTVTIECPPLSSYYTDVITITPKIEDQGDLFNGWANDGEPGEIITVNVSGEPTTQEHPNADDEIFANDE